MHRRTLIAGLAGLPIVAQAHHGWSSFDITRPLYLEGRAAQVAWRNPHVELDLELAAELRLPVDLPQRSTPAQSAPVDGGALLRLARLPARRDKQWRIELAPLQRIEAWKMAEIKPGDALAMVGYTFAAEKGDAVLRVEYLWAAGKTYALRSAPA